MSKAHQPCPRVRYRRRTRFRQESDIAAFEEGCKQFFIFPGLSVFIQYLHADFLYRQDAADLFQKLPRGLWTLDNIMIKRRYALSDSGGNYPGDIAWAQGSGNEIERTGIHTISTPSRVSISTSAISGNPISALGSSLTICSINAIPNPSSLALPAQ